MQKIIIAEITLEITRKDIKNIRLAVCPPDGRVRISVPLKFNEEILRRFVLSKLNWIKKHQARFAAREYPSSPKFVTGEAHYFRGQSYLLNVIYISGHPRVKIRDDTYIDLRVKVNSEEEQRQRIMLDWYRQNLKLEIPMLIEKWEPVMQVVVKDWGIKQMKTRWGTCNIQAQRIWLNLELMKKSPACLEYVVVHEMVHLLEPGHGDRFQSLMDKFLPPWKAYQQELNNRVVLKQ